MSDSLISQSMDIINRYMKDNGDAVDPAYVNWTKEREKLEEQSRDKSTLTFTDMLSLMVAEFQNQTIDNQASTTDMMNQLVQMSTMQAMTEMSSQMEELTLANVMSYSASLVGQTVTVGVYNSKKELVEVEGVVEATGMLDGQQVIFIDGEAYALSSIMAVGKLPATEETEGAGDSGDNTQTEGGETGDTGDTEDVEGMG